MHLVHPKKQRSYLEIYFIEYFIKFVFPIGNANISVFGGGIL